MYQHWHYWGPKEGEDREKGVENQFDKIMTKKFPNLKKKAISQYKDRVPSKESKQTQSKKYHN